MNKIAYTICSANHLPFAKTMFDSFAEFNKDYSLFILLVDKIDERFSKENFLPATIVEVHELQLPAFNKMSEQYSMLELACALKPFMSLFLFDKLTPESIIYIDTDILFFNKIDKVEEALLKSSIIITPHYTTPYPYDNYMPLERHSLRSGMYNAGFFALKNTDNAKLFLRWWAQHLENECFVDFSEGMFVDQNWLNFVPLFFNEVHILSDMGYNVAYWNLHERKVSETEGSYIINSNLPLIFFHISGYNMENTEVLSKHQNRFSLETLPALKKMYDGYRSKVVANNFSDFKDLSPAYSKKQKKPLGILKVLNKILSVFKLRLSKN